MKIHASQPHEPFLPDLEGQITAFVINKIYNGAQDLIWIDVANSPPVSNTETLLFSHTIAFDPSTAK